MKPNASLLFALIVASPLYAQPPVVVEKQVTETVSPGQTVVEETVVERPTPPPVVEETVVERQVPAPAPGSYNPRRQLGIVPRAVPVTPPGKVVETTETTHSVDGRVYNVERNVVIVEGRELPYVTVPVLFVKETAELLDTESRAALEQTAAAILDITKIEPTAVFDIEGHTSTDGTAEMNMQLSAQRAQRVYSELTQRYGVPSSALSAHGYGENYPSYPNGTESQMMLDRRVLVVRTR